MTDWQQYQPPPNLLIFKTNIKTKKAIRQIKAVLDAHQYITDWWVDTEDVDYVMRVEINRPISESDIIKLVQEQGMTCAPLAT
jgi:hypothetical protein